MDTLQDKASLSVNGSGTMELNDTAVTQRRSQDVPKPWEVRAAKAAAIVKNMSFRPEPVDRTIGKNYEDYIYFAYSAGRIKIGTSQNVGRRSKGLGGHSALPVTIILTVKGGFDKEAELHEAFTAERLHGEWFTLSPRMRLSLDQELCRKGRKNLKRAEADFRKWLQETAGAALK